MSSHQNRHRLQNRRDWLSIKLTHDRDPQWLDAATAGAETGGIGRRHRYGWMLLLQLFHHHIRPSAAQHALYVSLVDPFVDDQDQCRVITADHARKAQIAPLPSAACRPIPHITQCAPEASNSNRQPN